VSCSACTIEYSFDTLCRLVARAVLSLSDENILIRCRVDDVNGSVIVDDEADDDTDVDMTTDIVGHGSTNPN
jgi:hypothetical protein